MNTLENLNKKNHISKLCLIMLFAIIFLPDFAFAQIPTITTGNIGIPGLQDDASIGKTLLMTIAFIVFVLVIAVLGFGLADTVATFFRQLNDSRKEGDWGPLIRFLGLAFAVIAIVFVIIGYINSYVIDPANKMTALPFTVLPIV